MINFSGVKSITIPEGVVKQIQATFGGEGTNLAQTAIDTDGTIFNGLGYIDGYRMSSSGNTVEQADYCLTGYIKYSVGDAIRIYSEVTNVESGGQYVAVYDASFSLIAVQYLTSMVSTGAIVATAQADGTYVLDWDTSKPIGWANAIYCRFSFEGSGSSLKIVALKDLETVLLWKAPASIKNLVPESIDTDGSVFNKTGYQDNMRVRSAGTLGALSDYAATGFMPVSPGDVVRFTCLGWSNNIVGNTVNFGYISGGAFTSVGSYTTQPAFYGIYQGNTISAENIPAEESTGIIKVVVPSNTSITHLRLSCYGRGADLIVTVNEEIG